MKNHGNFSIKGGTRPVAPRPPSGGEVVALAHPGLRDIMPSMAKNSHPSTPAVGRFPPSAFPASFLEDTKHVLLVAFFAVCLLTINSAVFGYFQLPSLESLAEDADLVCLGKVLRKSELEKRGTQIFVQAFIVQEKILKGIPPEKGGIEVITVETATPDEVEDPVVPFPEKDSRVLLFLQKQGNTFSPVCARTAVFKVCEHDRLYPMALFSLSQVEDYFAHQRDGVGQDKK